MLTRVPDTAILKGSSQSAAPSVQSVDGHADSDHE